MTLKYSRIWLNYNFIISLPISFFFFFHCVFHHTAAASSIFNISSLSSCTRLLWLFLTLKTLSSSSSPHQLVKDFFFHLISSFLQKIHSHSIIFSSSSSPEKSWCCVSSISFLSPSRSSSRAQLQTIISSRDVLIHRHGCSLANMIIINLCLRLASPARSTSSMICTTKVSVNCMKLMKAHESSSLAALRWHSMRCHRVVGLLFIRFSIDNNMLLRCFEKNIKINIPTKSKREKKVVVADQLYSLRLWSLWMLPEPALAHTKLSR